MSNKFLMKIKIFLTALISGLLSLSAFAAPVGKWNDTPAGLPYIRYEGPAAYDVEGMNSDPYFLLGNYRINLFTHVSGVYQLISGERVWARFNADPSVSDYGANKAAIVIDNKRTELIGNRSIVSDRKKYVVESGVGFTRYDYTLDGGIKCSRMISVMPSENINEGNPCFLLTITIRNTSSSVRKLTFDEVVLPSFVPVNTQYIPEAERPFRYSYHTDVSFRCVNVTFDTHAQDFYRTALLDMPFIHEEDPQDLFIYSPDGFLSILEDGVHVMMNDVKIRSGETRVLYAVIGMSDSETKKRAEEMIRKAERGQYGAYASLWKRNLPDFSDERDNVRRREMYWNSHMLEASAMYDGYFKETFIPQGGDCTYRYGENLSNVNHLHAALPMCYANKDLAKSIIRYVMKHSDMLGRISAGNIGYGHLVPETMLDGDIQAEMLHVVSEYLRITDDYAFLDEWVDIYPVGSGLKKTVLQMIEGYFLYLRDEVGKGTDEYDVHFFTDRHAYNSRSHENYALLSSVLPNLAMQLKISGKGSERFIKSIERYHGELEKAFLEDHSAGKYAPGPYLTHMPAIPTYEKRESYLDEFPDNLDGMRISYMYQIITGVADFDRIDASSLSRSLSFNKLAESFPGTWVGCWTSQDLIDGRTIGLHTAYSSLPHAWALYSYLKMME